MSFRTVARFALVGWLVTSIAAPAAAQTPSDIRVRVLETRTGSFPLGSSVNTDSPIPFASAGSLSTTAPAERAPMPREIGTGIRVPQLGPLGFATDFNVPLNSTPNARGQTVSFAVGVFGGPEPTPELAPMPREVRRHGEIRLGLHFGGPEVIQVQYEHRIYGEKPVAPMPRPKNAVQIEYGIEFGSGSVQFHGPGRLDFSPSATMPRQVPKLAHGDLQLFTEEIVPGTVVGRPATRTASPGCCDHGGFCPPLTGSVPTPRAISMRELYIMGPHGEPVPIYPARTTVANDPMLTLGACRRDDNGTWWVEVIRVPQPKHSQVQLHPRFVCDPMVAQSGPAVAKPGCCAGNSCCPDGDIAARVIALQAPVKRGPLAETAFAGTWVRELNGMVIAATLSPCGEDLKLCLSQNANGHILCLTVLADCKIMKEGLVHGVITGVDLDVKRDPKAAGDAPFSHEAAEASIMLQQMVDLPFAFRVKKTSAGLMVSNLKLPTICGVEGPELAMIAGMFKPCQEGAIPVAKPMETRITGMTLPSGRYLEHYPQYFPADPAFPLARELSSQQDAGAPAAQPAPMPRACPAPAACGVPPQMMCPAPQLPPIQQPGWNPAQPANVPAGEFGMMVEVFGQMMGSKPQVLPQPSSTGPPLPAQGSTGFSFTPAAPGCGVSQPHMLPPVPALVAGTMPGQMQGFSYVPAPPGMNISGPPVMLPPPVAVQPLGYVAPPQVPEGTCPPCPLPTSTRPSITGTWVREVGPLVYVVKITPDHLTVTATGAMELTEGKTVTEGMVLTADYHLMRDGSTIVGLITGIDMTLEGDIPAEAQMPEMRGELSRLQKAYTDKPLAMSVRVYGDALVLGNVRLPEIEMPDGGPSPLATLGGRYKNATDKPLPKPRVMKAMPLPMELRLPGRQSVPVPVYEVPPDPPALHSTTGRIQPCPVFPPPQPQPVPFINNSPPAPAGYTLPANDRVPPQPPRVTEPAVPPMAVPTPPPEPQAADRRMKEFLYQSETTGPIGAPQRDVPAESKAKKMKKMAQELPGFLLNVYSSDPNVRVEQLLDSTEDFRQIQNEWRRFWFNDQPSHLTPERIHGGIR